MSAMECLLRNTSKEVLVRVLSEAKDASDESVKDDIKKELDRRENLRKFLG